MSEKTVFILGAGFSYPLGIPSQGELLDQILRYTYNDRGLSHCRAKLKNFIRDVYGLSSDQMKSLALEDVYTPIHQALVRDEAFKGKGVKKLREIEKCLNRLIAHVIDNGRIRNDGDCPPSQSHLYGFVEQLVGDKEAATTSDHFSILSLNWDITLDKALFNAIDPPPTLGTFKGAVDYGCHCVAYEKDRNLVPGIVARERQGKFSIKLLKLHGSFNWVHCPQCDRLYAHTLEKAGIKAYTGKAKCRKCPNEINLNASILLPTFQKDLAKFHYQHIWNQAAIELSEAKRLVFIGYSFPLADFDFRSLITKHVRDVKVDVVLFDRPRAKYEKWGGNPQYDLNLSPDNEDGKRYREYFGDKISNVYYEGVKYWVEHHMDEALP